MTQKDPFASCGRITDFTTLRVIGDIRAAQLEKNLEAWLVGASSESSTTHLEART